jgi:hypothetical protein
MSTDKSLSVLHGYTNIDSAPELASLVIKVSLDGGVTYVEATASPKIIIEHVSEEMSNGLPYHKDLHLTVSDEGLIVDLVDMDTGEVDGTSCYYIDDLVGNCV